MTIVLEIIGSVGESLGFLQEVDFEANGPAYPTGHAQATADIELAMQFISENEAIAFMMTRSKTCPLRPDGKPNRPLRAFNLKIRTVT